VDEEKMKNQLKVIDHLDLALPKVPMKALYKLHINVTHMIQLRAHTDSTSIELVNEEKRTLELTIDQV
jgi:hypothetical protein